MSDDPFDLENDPLLSGLPQKKGSLVSFLDWWDRPGQVVRNVARGNFGGALRQGVDIFGDLIDSAIPFVDAIPEASRPEDWVSGGELLGVKDPSLGKTALDIGVGAATDPWTYLSFGAVPALKNLARAGMAAKGLSEASTAERGLSTLVHAGEAGADAAKTVDPLASGVAAVGSAADKLKDASIPAAEELGGGFHFRVPFTKLKSRTFFDGQDVDPLSLVGKAGDAIYDQLPKQTQETVSNIGKTARQVFGAERVSDVTNKLLSKVGGSRFAVTKAGLEETRRILGQLPEDEQHIVGDIIDNYRWQEGMNGKHQLVGALDDSGKLSAVERVNLHPEITEDNAARIREAVYGIVGNRDGTGFSRRQAMEGLDRNIFRKPPTASGGPAVVGAKPPPSASRELIEQERLPGMPGGDPLMEAGDDLRVGMKKGPDGVWAEDTGLDQFPEEYLARQFRGVKHEGTELEQAYQRNNPLEARKFKDWTATKEFLEDPANAGVTYERSALKRLAQRAEDQGAMAGRAEIGKHFLGEGFALADDDAVKAVRSKIAELPEEEARVVLDAFDGMKKRGGFMGALAKANRYMKPYMVYGAVLPKVGSVMRNRISGIWQVLSNPEAMATPGVFKGMVKRLPSDMADSFSQAFGWKNLRTGELTDTLRKVDDAFAASGGVANAALSKLPKDVADAIQHGVLDGFVSSEDLLKEIGRSDWIHKAQSIADWPGKVFRGTEDRMRLGMFMDLRKGGKSVEDAAQIVKDSLYDYKVSSVQNRRARDLIPFWQFTGKSSVQQAKFLSKNPIADVALSNVYGSDPKRPVYPWVGERASIGLGTNDQGDPLYATGFGLPVETLGNLPNPFGADSLLDFGRDFERSTIASGQPLLKSAYEIASNRDPFFGTDAGSYDKIPYLGHQGAAGRLYNLAADTGALAPIDAPLHVLNDLTDETKPLGARALNVLTGANVVTVDEDKALQQQLSAYLERNPDVASSRALYSRSKDPETQAIIAKLNEVKQRLRAKRKAESATAE